MKKCHIGTFVTYLLIAALIVDHVHCNALLQVISPPDAMSDIASAFFNKNTGDYQVGQSLIGHLHYPPDDEDGCNSYNQSFRDHIATI